MTPLMLCHGPGEDFMSSPAELRRGRMEGTVCRLGMEAFFLEFSEDDKDFRRIMALSPINWILAKRMAVTRRHTSTWKPNNK
jgi:hypothetical protein